MNILLTGVAGFIGYHLADSLLSEGHVVTGVDNLNSYYSVNLKKTRLDRLSKHPKSLFSFHYGDICDVDFMQDIFNASRPTCVINLAAQAGVRYSLIDPFEYIRTNLTGFSVVIELSKQYEVSHFLYASSSSVYGGNDSFPYRETDSTDSPLSLYAATKKSNELIAHSYSHLFDLPTTGLRFFTVYGPWGRPDMALYLFADAIRNGKELEVYNNGNMLRDFTYIDDVVSAVSRLAPTPPPIVARSAGESKGAPFRVFNVGNSNPVQLMNYIRQLEISMGMVAQKRLLGLQPGDVQQTASNCDALEELIGPLGHTSITEGVEKFVQWFNSYNSHD